VSNQVTVADPDEADEPPAGNKASAATTIIACFDVNDDLRVNIIDIGFMVLYQGVSSSQPQYDLLFDLDGNGAINIIEIGRVLSQSGRRC
jgi:hypothetical protein